MSTLSYGQLARTAEQGDQPTPAIKPPWRALIKLVVLLAGAVAGGVAAHLLLDSPGVQASVVNAASGAAGAVVTTITAYLFVRRMHRTFALADALLAAALTLLPGICGVAAVVAALHEATDREFAQFVASTAASVVASVGLVAAVAAGHRTLAGVRQTDRVHLTALVAGAVIVAGATLIADRAGAPAGSQAPVPSLLIAVHVCAAFGAAVAAACFFRASTRRDDPVLPWLATAAAIVAASNLADALLPWSPSDTLSGGSLVLGAGWLALLVAGVRDFEWAHRRDAEDAVLGERRRLARELHDGLAQELAYITTESRRLVGHPGAEHLAQAAERALEESRAAILALTRPTNEPLERTVADTAQSIAARAGIDVVVAVRPGLGAPHEVRQALLRILREAMTNAVRHGHPRTIRVSLDGPAPLVLTIGDDGLGFEPGAGSRPDSLGLQSMRERAMNLGGSLSIESVAGEGTTVAVVLP